MAQNDRTTGLVGNSAIKVPCRAASTAALTLSGEQTVDGVALVTGDRCLAKDQASGVDNGIYVVDTGAWERAPDADGVYDWVTGTLVRVVAGTQNAGTIFELTTTGTITVGTSSLSFSSIGLPSTPVAVASGGTGAASAVAGLSNLGVIQVTAEAGTNTITGTIDALVTAYRTDQLFILNPANTNTSSATFNPTPSGGSALGAKNIYWKGAALTGGELIAGVPVLLHYDGTQYNIIGNGSAVPVGLIGALGDLLVGTADNAVAALSAYPQPMNLSLSVTVSGNACTFAVKTRAGNDPSAASPVLIPFRSATANTGDYSWIALTAATSIVINNTAKLGAIDATAFRIWIVAFNDGGTVRLGVINCSTTTASDNAINFYPLGAWPVADSTLEDNASDSWSVFYTDTAAVTSKAYTILGWASWESGLTTAGVWDTNPSRVQIFGPGMPLPGTPIQTQSSVDGSAATGVTALPWDNTVPDIAEGDQYLVVSISPISAANMLKLEWQTFSAHSASGERTAALFKSGTAAAKAAVASANSAAAMLCELRGEFGCKAAGTSSQNWSIRIGSSSGGGPTTTFNGVAGAGKMGGVLYSWVKATELMG